MLPDTRTCRRVQGTGANWVVRASRTEKRPSLRSVARPRLHKEATSSSLRSVARGIRRKLWSICFASATASIRMNDVHLVMESNSSEQIGFLTVGRVPRAVGAEDSADRV